MVEDDEEFTPQSKYTGAFQSGKENSPSYTSEHDKDGVVSVGENISEDSASIYQNAKRQPNDKERHEGGRYSDEHDDAGYPGDARDPRGKPRHSLGALASLAVGEEKKELGPGARSTPPEPLFRPFNTINREPLEYLKEIAAKEALRIRAQMHERALAERREAMSRKIYRQSSTENVSSETTSIEARGRRPSRVPHAELMDRGDVADFNCFDEGIFHLNPRTKLYSCPYPGCTKEFPSLSRIKRHYIIHTDIKPFRCLNKECNKSFSRKDNMLQHYRVHCPYTHR